MSENRSPRGKILAVDDEKHVLTILKEIMETHNYQVTTASSGADALICLKKTDFDVLVTDLVMPEIDGIDLMKRAKEIRPDIPCMVITGKSTIHAAIEALEAGAFHYLQKPFRASEIDMALRRGMERIRLIREVRDKQAELERQNRRLLAEIEERKKTEADLHQTRQRLTTILNAMSEQVFYLDSRRRIQWANQAAFQASGKTFDELIGASYRVIWGKTEEDHGCPEDAGLKTGISEISEGETRDGRIIRLKMYPLKSQTGEISGLAAVGKDITEDRIQTQMREMIDRISGAASGMRRLDAFYDDICRILAGGLDFPVCLLGIADPEGEAVALKGKWDPAKRMTERPDRFILRSPVIREALERGDIVAENRSDTPSDMEASPRMSMNGEAFLAVPLIADDRLIGFALLMDFIPRRYPLLLLQALRVIGHRTTVEIRRLQAENRSRSSELRYRTLFQESPISFWELDLSDLYQYLKKNPPKKSRGSASILKNHPETESRIWRRIRILDLNRASLALFGADSPEQLEQEIPKLIFTRGSSSAFSDALNAVREARTEFRTECGGKTLKGEPLSLMFHWTVIQGGGTPMSRVLATLSDLTGIRKAEKERALHRRQLMQADRMISLGSLVTGMTHEINNPNNIIMMNAPILQEAWKSARPVLDAYHREHDDFRLAETEYEEMREHIPSLFSGVVESSQRINGIINSLKAYARPDEGMTDTCRMNAAVDINAVVQSAIGLIRGLIRSSTRYFTFRPAPELPPVKGNGEKLKQVIINLLRNACQSLGSDTEAVCVSTGFRSGDRTVRVEIRDEGMGIPDEVAVHIMTPFYTTRRDRGGTGLGLSVAAGIVEEHGGKLTAESSEGRGALFTVILPVMPPYPDAPAPPDETDDGMTDRD